MRRQGDQLDAALSRLSRQLPASAARFVDYVRKPTSAFVRRSLAVVLIAGGFFGFLPILGFWMIPLGLALLAKDLPFLQPPLARLVGWIAAKLENGNRSKRPGGKSPER